MYARRAFRPVIATAAAFAAALLLTASGAALADPPSRVARLAYAEGAVSFAPAGDGEWVRAIVNRPLVTGDRLWSDSDGRVEIQFATTAVRLGAMTDVVLVNLDDRIQQFQLTQGSLQLRVRSLGNGEQVEVDTPNFAFVATRPGDYRLDVAPDGSATRLHVRAGEGDVYGDGAAYHVSNGQAVRFAGTALGDAEYLALAPPDAFERWAESRDQRYGRLVSARYVAPDVVGYEDLDQYGTWRTDATYGNIWIPRSVPADWAPYRNGHWSWIDPWGWTWVDDAPWGFAPFHYGRWAEVGNGWGWVPGPPRQRAVYAPALVAFIGGAGFAISATSGSSIGWFPLAPGEVYRPAYTVSRDYFTRVNVTNTVVNTTVVTNIYNTRDRPGGNVRYANMARPAAITAVPPAAFAQSQPVQRAAIAVNAQVLNKAEVLPLAKVAPQRQSVTGAAPPARAAPAAAAQRSVVSKAPPPPPPATLESKLPAMRDAPGKPIDRPANTARAAPPGAPAPAAAPGAPQARVVNATAPKPLPAKAPGGNAERAPDGRGKGPGGAPASATPPAAQAPQGAAVPPPAQGAAPIPSQGAAPPPPQGAAPAPPQSTPPLPPGDRGKGNGKGSPQRAPDNVAPQPAPQNAAPATAPAPAAPPPRPPQANAPAPAPATAPTQRSPEERGKGKGPPSQRAPDNVAPQPAPQSATPARSPSPSPAPAPPLSRPPEANAPPPAPAAPTQRSPEERGKGKGPPPQRAPDNVAPQPAPQSAAPAPAPAPAAPPPRPPEANAPRPAPQAAPTAPAPRPAPQPAPPAPAPRPAPQAAPPAPTPQAAPPAPPPQSQPAPRNDNRGKGDENRGKGKDDDKDKDKDKEKK